GVAGRARGSRPTAVSAARPGGAPPRGGGGTQTRAAPNTTPRGRRAKRRVWPGRGRPAMSRPPNPPRLSRSPIGPPSLATACGKLVVIGTAVQGRQISGGAGRPRRDPAGRRGERCRDAGRAPRGVRQRERRSFGERAPRVRRARSRIVGAVVVRHVRLLRAALPPADR